MPLVLQRDWVGRRVSVRRVVERAADGSLRFSDLVGELLELDGETATVQTREARVEIILAHVTAARLALPSTADELALEGIAARGWRAAETAPLGGWLLRANSGFTGRANSVLPLRPPGIPLADALDQAREWYAARGLPVRLQVPTEARRLLDAELGERGWAPEPDVAVLAARLDMLLRPFAAASGSPPVTVSPEPGPDWLALYRGGAALDPAARALLVRHDHVGFAAVHDGGELLAIGRGAIDDDWLGVTAVEVAPDARRRGLATAVMAALWHWGSAGGARRSYLQVSTDNLPALALYERLGYWHHHDYRYRIEPAHIR
jgi:N-acetylglutamate synthase